MSGHAFITGGTNGNLGGPHAGSGDAFLTRYDSDGTLAWTRQFGTVNEDNGTAVAVDATGHAYVSGRTTGSLGGPNAGASDAFLSRYTSDGTLTWSQQIGTSSEDFASDVAVDMYGNAYVTGYTDDSLGGPHAGGRDVFLVRYNADGSLAWTKQIGTNTLESSNGVAVDNAGNVYITGYTVGSLAGPNAGDLDAFLVKYDQITGGHWLNTSNLNNHWSRDANWSSLLAPFALDSLTFDSVSTYTVMLDRNVTQSAIAISNGNVTLDFNSYTLQTSNGLTISSGATLNGTGTILGDVTVATAGTLAPGNSPGSLDISGNLANSGTLEFEIAGLASNQFDRILVTGDFTAGGTLQIVLDGYSPVAGDVFDLMDFANLLGNGYVFDLTAAVLGANLTWNTANFATTGSIVVEAIPEPHALAGLLTLLAVMWRQRRC